ncbi:hypothetical protein HOH87_03650 [bacterium]|nr:hypothetical protein [bacterium]
MFGYYISKLYMLAQRLRLERSYGLIKKPGLSYGPLQDNFEWKNKVVLLAWDSQLMHLGDLLFYLPLLDRLVRQGVSVALLGESPIGGLFRAIGCRWEREGYQEHLQDAVVLGKSDMLHQVAKYESKNTAFIGMDYRRLVGDARIARLISTAVEGVFKAFKWDWDDKVSSFEFSFLRKVLEGVNTKGAWREEVESLSNESSQIWVFNNYLSSGFRGNGAMQEILIKRAEDKKKATYIYIGSENDRLKSPGSLPFIDLDLRGKLTPLEIVELLAMKEVAGAICFDTFISHVATLLEKDVDCVPRSKHMANIINRRFVPFY